MRVDDSQAATGIALAETTCGSAPPDRDTVGTSNPDNETFACSAIHSWMKDLAVFRRTQADVVTLDEFAQAAHSDSI